MGSDIGDMDGGILLTMAISLKFDIVHVDTSVMIYCAGVVHTQPRPKIFSKK